MSSAVVPLNTPVSGSLSLEHLPPEYVLSLLLLFCFTWIDPNTDFYPLRYSCVVKKLGSVLCFYRGLLSQYSDHKAKHYQECLKQGKFFRWGNIITGGRKQFVPNSDSWTCVCQRMACWSPNLHLLFPVDIAKPCSHFLSIWPWPQDPAQPEEFKHKPQAHFKAQSRVITHSPCPAFPPLPFPPGGFSRRQMLKGEEELGPWFTTWKKMFHCSRTPVSGFT